MYTMKSLGGLLAIGPLLFAAFSSSTSYQLQSYGINGAASNSASSTTYKLESSTGQVQSVSSSSATYTDKSGSIQAQQSSVPPAPTLSNGSGTYYNKLGLIISTGSNPSDATYAVAISNNSFTTTFYVQADGSLNSTPLFQTYTQWGGATGTTIIGLTNATTYQVKVSAMQGKFTQSAYGPVASSATASPSISFSVTPNTLTLPNLLSGTVVASSSITSTFATNASYGGSIYVADSNAGLKSISRSNTIASASATLSAAAHGYGLRGTGETQTSGGPLSLLSPFNGATGVVGALSTTPQAVFSSTSPTVGGSTTAVLQAKASSTDPAAADYVDTLTFTAAASF
jgi:hypothetical protein